MVYVVGIGPGAREYILPKAIEVLNESEFIVGFSRAIASLDFILGNKIKINSLKEIIKILNENEDKKISIVASGDPTFFGICEYIKKNYVGQIEVIPGISSFQYLTCKLEKAWSNAYTGSLHGRKDEFIKKVKENILTIWLTDNKNNPSEICKMLIINNIECTVIVGENLSYNDEIITIDVPKNLLEKKFSDLSIVMVERKQY